MKNISFLAIPFLSFFISFTFSLAQDRQGNIVEYFGKEKVEEIHEGKVIHIFNDGLILRLQRSGITSSTTPKNPVYSRFLLEDNLQIQEGTEFIKDESGNGVSWEKIEVDEKK